jgi:hypothetical protein
VELAGVPATQLGVGGHGDLPLPATLAVLEMLAPVA